VEWRGNHVLGMIYCGYSIFLPVRPLSILSAHIGSPQCTPGGPACMQQHLGSHYDSHSGEC